MVFIEEPTQICIGEARQEDVVVQGKPYTIQVDMEMGSLLYESTNETEQDFKVL